jgi:uncharacterized membrane protein YebE (DUF533 family)
MPDLDPAMVGAALAELERMITTLSQMSAWADGDTAGRERAAIMLEDAGNAVRAAGWELERADPQRPDPARIAQLVHRRLVPPAGLETG